MFSAKTFSTKTFSTKTFKFWGLPTEDSGGQRKITLPERLDIRWIAREEEELITMTTLVMGVLHEVL